jgi:hypothetical protein
MVLPWLGRWTCLAGTRYFCPAGTRDICPVLAALVSPVHNFFRHLTLFHFICPHRLTSWALGRESCNVACLLSQNNRNQSFSYFFCLMIEGSGSVPLTKGSGSRMAQKHTDPTDPDPDPQHWLTEVCYRAEDVGLFASIARQQKFLGKNTFLFVSVNYTLSFKDQNFFFYIMAQFSREYRLNIAHLN